MIKELMEKRNDLMAKADEILNKAKAEKREVTKEESDTLTGYRDQVRQINETMKLEDELRELDGYKPTEKREEKPEESVETRERNAFENYIRGRVIHERTGELTPATNPASGGALIPTTIAAQIVKKVYDICPVLERSQHYNVKGKLELPKYGPTSGNSPDNITVAYATEFSALSSHSGAFTTVELTGFLAGALTKISNSLINNAQFDVVGFVVDEMATAMARFIEKECLVGTNNKVSGLSTLTNGVTAAAQAAITADEVVKLHDKVKDVYQQNAVWIMSSATRTALRLLRTNDGLYLLNDDVSSPFGTTLLGKPVYVSDNMPEIAHSAKPIYYGDLSGLATKFSEEINIQVLREKYADEHATGVVGWMEFDAKVVDEQRLAVLTMA